MERDAALSLARILPRLDARLARAADPAAWATFRARLETHFGTLFPLLRHLYGGQYDFFYHLEQLLLAAGRSWLARPGWLKQLDARREADPEWFQSQRMVGGVLYVDLFSGTLAKLCEHLPYFKELGLTYLHLMPLFAAPEGNSDGGYAVSSYRHVSPSLGAIEEDEIVVLVLGRASLCAFGPFVFIGGMVEDEIDHQADSMVLELARQLGQLFDCAQGWADAAIAADSVAAVAVARRRVEQRH